MSNAVAPTRLSLKATREYLADQHGQSVTSQTIKNWIRNGVHGVRLKAEKVGRFWVTSPEWIQDFVNGCTAAANGATDAAASPNRTPSQMRRDAKAAAEHLERTGFRKSQGGNGKKTSGAKSKAKPKGKAKSTAKVADLARTDVPD